jgi:signal peptide peptidase SppA
MEKSASDHWKPECVAKHLGPWLIEPGWFQQAVSAVKAGLWQPKQRAVSLAAIQVGSDGAIEARTRRDSEDEPIYFVDSAGLAIVPIDGPMLKGESKYGGANTLAIRRQVRMAAKDPDVKGIFLAIDSPGGTVAGTQELAADVADAGRAKPVFAHIDDLGASAAYWVASQAGRITASPTSEVGSIGVLAVVEDSSGMAEKKGIEVHVISTGPYKGAGVEGAPITKDQLAYMQDRVDAVHEHFLDAVAAGRGEPRKTVDGWSSGKVWIAAEAARMGLIDEVMRMDEALNAARAEVFSRDADVVGNTVTGTHDVKISVRFPAQKEEAIADARTKRVAAAIAARETKIKKIRFSD